MGREIRMVPPNWDHPKVVRRNGELDYQPMFDQRFEDAADEWKRGYVEWEAKGKQEYHAQVGRLVEYWEYEGDPPEREYYRPWKDEEATWFQVWQTVSEGTPVTPPFATREELIEYLVANGDFWDQSRRKRGVTDMACGPWTREQATAFVNAGWAPSMAIVNGAVIDSRDCATSLPPTSTEPTHDR